MYVRIREYAQLCVKSTTRRLMKIERFSISFNIILYSVFTDTIFRSGCETVSACPTSPIFTLRSFVKRITFYGFCKYIYVFRRGQRLSNADVKSPMVQVPSSSREFARNLRRTETIEEEVGIE